MVINLADDIVQ